MNRDTAIGLLPRIPFPSGAVRQIAVPPAVRGLSTLSRIDYADSFLLDSGSAQSRTCLPPSSNWRAHSPMFCGPEPSSYIHRWSGTSSSKPTQGFPQRSKADER